MRILKNNDQILLSISLHGGKIDSILDTSLFRHKFVQTLFKLSQISKFWGTAEKVLTIWSTEACRSSHSLTIVTRDCSTHGQYNVLCTELSVTVYGVVYSSDISRPLPLLYGTASNKNKVGRNLGSKLSLKQRLFANYPLVFSQSSAIDKIKPHSQFTSVLHYNVGFINLYSYLVRILFHPPDNLPVGYIFCFN